LASALAAAASAFAIAGVALPFDTIMAKAANPKAAF